MTWTLSDISAAFVAFVIVTAVCAAVLLKWASANGIVVWR